jgi:5-methylthioadenosine/S-adenosylhomocysteine deaminase
MKKLLLENAEILNEDAALFKGDILVSAGKIETIRKKNGSRTAGQKNEDVETIDCTGRVVTPGFTILHAHSPMHILRGLAEDVSIENWFNREIWPYESKLLPDDITCGAKMCMAEMIDNGVTAFADHYFGGEAIIRAAEASGIRLDLAPTIFCPEGSPSADIRETERLMEKYEGKNRIHIRFGPHAPYTVHAGALAEICDEAKKMHTGIHIHVSETAAQVKESKEKFGITPIMQLDVCGGMDVPCILAHALYLEKEDLKCLRDDTYIASSPKTYMKLGMGLGNIWKYDEEIRNNHAIGTDGAASSNTVDPVEEARLYALIGKTEDRAEKFRAGEIWKLLMNGAKALPFGSGKIKEGSPADLCIWNLRTPASAPVYDPLIAILYSACPSRDITDVLVGGKFVKKDGNVQMETAPLVREAERRAEEITIRGQGKSRISF